MCSIQEHFSVTVLRILVLRVRKQPAGRGLERSRPVAVALCSKAAFQQEVKSTEPLFRSKRGF